MMVSTYPLGIRSKFSAYTLLVEALRQPLEHHCSHQVGDRCRLDEWLLPSRLVLDGS